MGYPVTLNGRTYTLADFEGNNYVDGLPDAFEDFVTHAGDVYNDTSTTSNSIGTGSKTFTVTAGKPYQAGTPLRIADAAAPATNFLDAVVTSYSGTTLVVEAIGYGGSGTKTSWTVNIGGAKTIDGTLGVSQGGTGATTAAAARTNLDTYSKTEADSRFLNVSGEASDVTMTGNVTIGDAAGDTLTVNATADFKTGFNVDGTITADGLTVDGDIRVNTTSTPSTVGVNLVLADTSNASALQLHNNVGGSEGGSLLYSSSASDFNVYNYIGAVGSETYVNRFGIVSNGDILFYEDTGTTPKMVWKSADERLGIGTSSPAAKLDITGSDPGVQMAVRGWDMLSVGSPFALEFGGVNASEWTTLKFFTSGSEAMRIDPSGSVGIGSAPSTWASTVYDVLEVGDSIGVANISGRRDGINGANFGLNWHYESGATDTYIGSSFATNYQQAAGQHIWSTAASGTAGNAITWSELMRISSSGDWMVSNTVANLASGYSAQAGCGWVDSDTHF